MKFFSLSFGEYAESTFLLGIEHFVIPRMPHRVGILLGQQPQSIEDARQQSWVAFADDKTSLPEINAYGRLIAGDILEHGHRPSRTIVREGIDSTGRIGDPDSIALKIATATPDGRALYGAGSIEIFRGAAPCLERGISLCTKAEIVTPERLYVLTEGMALLVKPAGYPSAQSVVIKHVGHELRRFAIGETTP